MTGRARGVVAAALAAATFLLLPLVTFGVAVLRNDGYVRLSALVAHEEMLGAVRGGSLRETWEAAVLYVNFTRGALNAEIYRLTVGQLVLSTALGALVGLNVVAAGRLRSRAGATGGFGAAGGAAATLCSATAGAFGCCGGSTTAALVASFGVSFPLAVALGQAAWIVQLVTLAILAANLVRLRRRRFAERALA